MKLFRRLFGRRVLWPKGPTPAILRIRDGDLVIFGPGQVNEFMLEEMVMWLRNTGRPNVRVWAQGHEMKTMS